VSDNDFESWLHEVLLELLDGSHNIEWMRNEESDEEALKQEYSLYGPAAARKLLERMVKRGDVEGF